MDQLEEGMKLMRKASRAAGIHARNEELRILKKLGVGSKTFLGRLKRDHSPGEILNTIEQQKKEHAQRRIETSEELKSLYNEIVSKKRDREETCSVSRETLDVELKNLLTEYKVLERQLAVCLENERLLEQLEDLFMDCLAYDMRRIDEKQVDLFNKYLKDKKREKKDARSRAPDNYDLDAELAKFKENEEPE